MTDEIRNRQFHALNQMILDLQDRIQKLETNAHELRTACETKPSQYDDII